MRNVNVIDGLTNNTRVQVKMILENAVVAELTTQPYTRFILPRIRFHYRLPFSRSFEIVRTQFPLRRAFALTYNKSQGQTLIKVLLDVRSHLFNHGSLYVGLSRVQLYSNVAFFLNDYRIYKCPHNIYDGCPVIRNIVYDEVLQYCV